MSLKVDMIECNFIKRTEYGKFANVSKREKYGKYHGSYFYDVDGFGKTRWVICAKIEVKELQRHLSEGLVIDEMAQRCLNFLNQPPKRKRKTKKPPKLPYGNLGVHRVYLKNEDDAQLTVLLTIDEFKNKNFWGKGQRHAFRRRRTRTDS